MADEARAEQGRGFRIAVIAMDGESIAGVGNGAFGISAVDLVAREPGLVAEVFAPHVAIAAVAARPSEPGNTDTIAGRKAADSVAKCKNGSDDLVSRDDR